MQQNASREERRSYPPLFSFFYFFSISQRGFIYHVELSLRIGTDWPPLSWSSRSFFCSFGRSVSVANKEICGWELICNQRTFLSLSLDSSNKGVCLAPPPWKALIIIPPWKSRLLCLAGLFLTLGERESAKDCQLFINLNYFLSSFSRSWR